MGLHIIHMFPLRFDNARNISKYKCGFVSCNVYHVQFSKQKRFIFYIVENIQHIIKVRNGDLIFILFLYNFLYNFVKNGRLKDLFGTKLCENKHGRI